MATVIAERYALTLKKPARFPAEVNNIELPVQRKAVTIAAEFPMRLVSNFSLSLKPKLRSGFKPFQCWMPSSREESTETKPLTRLSLAHVRRSAFGEIFMSPKPFSHNGIRVSLIGGNSSKGAQNGRIYRIR
jgi:hypothetical protein